jgi:hypothetical protein
VEEGVYIICLDKKPEKIKPKDQDSDETEEKIIKISSDNKNFGLHFNIFSFKELFYSKYKIIM